MALIGSPLIRSRPPRPGLPPANPRDIHVYHVPTDEARAAASLQTIVDAHAGALEWMEDYTAVPHPFDTLDVVLLPSFQFTGMEHPGAIFYGASALLLDESATQNQLLGRASVIAHETAHMWFGDLVTMRWFDDVWLKEVFANFMAAKVVNPSFPTVNHDLRFLLSNHPAAYAVDRTAGANPIRQPLDNLQDAGSLYGSIIYQKAPIVMRQLERLMGDDAFRDGLREYLKAHAMANAAGLWWGLRRSGQFQPLPGWPRLCAQVLLAVGLLGVGLVWAAGHWDWVALQAQPWGRAGLLAGVLAASGVVYFATLGVIGVDLRALLRR